MAQGNSQPNVNIKKYGGTATTLGQKAMTASMPVVLSSDQTSVPVAATLNAETTKVIGVVRVADGAGNLLTSTGNALDVNLKTSAATVTVSGTVTANAGTNLNTSLLAVESGGNLATLAGAVSAAVVQSNTKQINGVTVLMGNGITGTGSQRVTIASDNTAFTVNAAQSGTWNIGTVTAVTAITNALPAGSNVIGHVITDTGSTTAVTGTVATTEATLDAALISQEATTSGVKGLTVFGAVTTAKPTYVTGKSDALSLDVNGLLRVSLADTPANGVKLLVTPDSVALPANQSVNVAQVAGTATSVGNGATDSGTQRTALSSDTATGSLTGTGSVTMTTLSGASTVGAQITGTWAGTVLFEGSVDGSTFFTLSAFPYATGALISSTTANGQWQLSVAGLTQMRARCSVFTSGTIVITLRNTQGTTPFGTTQFLSGGQSGQVQGNGSSGSADGGNPVKVGGKYNTTPPTFTDGNRADLQVDSKGSLREVIMDAAGNARGANVDANNNLGVVLAAETTKVLGVTRTADGAGNLLTTNSTTYTAKFAADGNLLGTLGTAFSTAGKVDVKAADGDVFVRQATGTNLHTVVDSGTITTVTTVTTVSAARIVGNGGAVLDAVNTAATAPASGVLTLGIFNTTEPSPTTGQSVGIQLDSKGRQRQVMMDAAGNTRGVNVTAGNSAQIDVTSVAGTAVVTGGVAGSLSVGGANATNVAITTNPVNNGAQAVSAENTAVTATRMVQLVADLVGKLIVLPYSNPENFINGTTAAIVDTSTTSVIAAQAASVRSYITQITVTNSHATVGTFVKITDGASTILWEAYAAAAGGGASATFNVPLRGTAATAVNAICVTTGANVIVSISGYKGV